MRAAPPPTTSSSPRSLAAGAAIAGHACTVAGRAGGVMTLHVDLGGEPLGTLARSLAKLEGVRVTGGPEGTGGTRCYLVTCLGFKLVLSAPAEGRDDLALALISRVPQHSLGVVSELASLLDRLLSEPPAAPAPPRRLAAAGAGEDDGVEATPGSRRRSALRPGQPLARKTELRRKTPLARGPFKRS